MKKKILRYMALAVTLFTLTGCNDIVNYDEGYKPLEDVPNAGAPEITGVYAVGDTMLASPISQGETGQMVRIVGKNLNKPTKITFNTIEADLSQVYSYSTSANVVIPSELSMGHNNMLVYTTDLGSDSIAFTVPYPQLQVDGLMCEFMDAGDSVTITGRNFDYYDFANTSRVTLNGNQLGVGSITNTSMKVLVPAGTPDNSTLRVEWTDGTTGEPEYAELPFRPTSNLLYGDFSDVSFSLDGVLAMDVETDGDVSDASSSLGNPNLHFTGSLDAWSWNTCDISRNMIDIGQIENLDDYVLKFEILTPSSYPLTEASPLQFSFNWGESYKWVPGDGSGLNTYGDWQTVTLPLAPMATAGIMPAGQWQTLRITFQPEATYTADFRLANLRIVHK